MAVHTVDDYLNNGTWVARIKSLFDFVDLNKNGTLEVDDWIRYVDNVNREVKPNPKLYENLRQAMLNAIAAMGVLPGKKLTKDEFVKNFAEMAVTDSKKRSRDEKTYIGILENAWYDTLDINHDGFVTLDEYRIVLKAWGFTPEEVEAGFSAMDTNKNGKISRKEFVDHVLDYWFGLSEDQARKGMFGARYDS